MLSVRKRVEVSLSALIVVGDSLQIGQNVMNEERLTHDSSSETEATPSAEK
jgi:hypothetical protein